MRVVGVDPGLKTTGYGVVEISQRDVVLVEGGVVDAGPTHDLLETRLSRLYDGMVALLEQFAPDALALEDLYSHYAHPTTAILMGHARGVICLAAAKSGVPVHHYAATQIKSCLTGNGHASKEQMQRAIQARLGLKAVPHPPDVADALGAALCHNLMANSPVLAAVRADRQRGSSRRR